MKPFSLILAAFFGICAMVNAIAQQNVPMSAAGDPPIAPTYDQNNAPPGQAPMRMGAASTDGDPEQDRAWLEKTRKDFRKQTKKMLDDLAAAGTPYVPPPKHTAFWALVQEHHLELIRGEQTKVQAEPPTIRDPYVTPTNDQGHVPFGSGSAD